EIELVANPHDRFDFAHRLFPHAFAWDDCDHRGAEHRGVEAARGDFFRALEHLPVELLVGRERNDGEVVGAARKAARARTFAEYTDDRELVPPDAYGLADRIDVREQRLPRTIAEDDHLAAVIDFGRQEQSTEFELGRGHRRRVLGGAENPELLRLLVTVVNTRLAIPVDTQPHVDECNRWTVPPDRVRILLGQVRPARDFEEAFPGREADGSPLLHHDRVRTELADGIAQRVVE